MKKGVSEEEIRAFGEPLLETYCNKYAYVQLGYSLDLDDQCYRAVHAVMLGKPFKEAQALILREHPGGAGARAVLADLFKQQHATVPA